jgi:Uma2 family endonuclease
MAENTLRFEWIVRIQGSLDAQFASDPNILVVGDLLWYPVQGNNKLRVAPDVMVVFGRPKGHRSSYLQWQEGGIAPQVVFEVRSPGNTDQEMQEKLTFYETYGVEEYYLYDPDRITLHGWQRSGARLVPIPNVHGWLSPRLQIRFLLSATDLTIFHPDGRPFATYLQVVAQREQAEQAARDAQEAARKAEDARRLAEDAAASAQKAQREADERAEKLAAKLRALGIDPDAS